MKSYYFFLLMPFIWACNESDLETSTPTNKVTEEYNHIISKANEAISAINSNSRNSSPEVKSVYPWLSSDIYADSEYISRSNNQCLPDTMLYVVNYNDNAGFVLISDTKRYNGVVAIIEDGNFIPGENISNSGMQFFFGIV